MKIQVCRCLPFFLALFLPGSGYLAQRSQQTSGALLTSDDESSSLKRRYWNDDLQPCIKKYCYKFQDTALYRKCLQKYCPQGLIAIPRDLEDIALGFSSQLATAPDSQLTSLCAAIFCGMYTGAEYGSCQKEKCTFGHASSSSSSSTMAPHDDLLLRLGAAFDRVCKETLCQGLSGTSYGKCLIGKCLRQVEGGAPSNTGSSGLDLYRKRRVNDDVSQCIQSYCGGKGFESRIVCIVRNCHHPSG